MFWFSFVFLDHVVVEYSCTSVERAASIFRVDAINQYAVHKTKRLTADQQPP
jgi:hypothetical protein